MIRKSMPSDLIRWWVPVFPRDKREAFARRSCSNKKLERDDDSKKSHPALGTTGLLNKPVPKRHQGRVGLRSGRVNRIARIGRCVSPIWPFRRLIELARALPIICTSAFHRRHLDSSKSSTVTPELSI